MRRKILYYTVLYIFSCERHNRYALHIYLLPKKLGFGGQKPEKVHFATVHQEYSGELLGNKRGFPQTHNITPQERQKSRQLKLLLPHPLTEDIQKSGTQQMPTYRAECNCCPHTEPRARVTMHPPCHRVPKPWLPAKQMSLASHRKVPNWSNKYAWNICTLYSLPDKPVLTCNKAEEICKAKSLAFPALASKKLALK